MHTCLYVLPLNVCVTDPNELAFPSWILSSSSVYFLKCFHIGNVIYNNFSFKKCFKWIAHSLPLFTWICFCIEIENNKRKVVLSFSQGCENPKNVYMLALWNMHNSLQVQSNSIIWAMYYPQLKYSDRMGKQVAYSCITSPFPVLMI